MPKPNCDYNSISISLYFTKNTKIRILKEIRKKNTNISKMVKLLAKRVNITKRLEASNLKKNNIID